MVRITTWLTAITLAMTAMVACEEEVDQEALRQEESRYFQLYMDTNYPDLEPQESGLYYINIEEGDGATPDSGDYVLINYLAQTVPDGNVFDTYTEEFARQYNLYQEQVLYGPYKYQHGSEMEGMREGLSMMKEGGIARLLFTSDLGFGADGFGQVEPFESLLYDIELLEVIEQPADREFEQMQNYLDTVENYTRILDEDIDVVMYYIPDRIGEGDSIQSDDMIDIYYTGQLLDGRVFDSNTDEDSPLQVTLGEEEVIQGLELGLTYFRKGGEGRLLVPHPLGYGEEGSKVSRSNKTSVPPFEALLFHIEVLNPETTTAKK